MSFLINAVATISLFRKRLWRWCFLDSHPKIFKGALSGLRPFPVTEGPLKMMKNAFYFTSKALFVLKIIKFLS